MYHSIFFYRYDDNLASANKESVRKGMVAGLGQSAFWFFVYTAFAVAFWYGMYLTRTGELAGFEPGETLTVRLNFIFYKLYILT